MAEFRDRPSEPEQPYDDHRQRHRPDRPGEGDDKPHHDAQDRWDPVVGDGKTISSFELDRERGWLDGPDRPPPLADTRPYDEIGGLAEPAPRDQWALEEAVPKDDVGEPERFPDVREPWFELVNDGGRDADPFRGNNCLDCSLALISTWHGDPQVCAPRYPDHNPDGTPDDRSGEKAGMRRAEEWLGGRFERAGKAEPAFTTIEEKLREGGHGSAAVIVNTWNLGGAHAWNAVNYRNEILWADPQVAKVDTEPIHKSPRVRDVWAIVIDREGNQL